MNSPLSHPVLLDDLLLYRLSRLVSTSGHMVIRLCEGGWGITRREWRVIALLGQEDGIMSSILAERIQLDRARTSRAVSSLVEKKLVHRTAGAADRRQARLSLTPEGQAVYDGLMPRIRAINREVLSVLTPAEVGQLDGALERLQAQAGQMAVAMPLPKADRRRGGRGRRSEL
jgi:DNA-binding MarR family transcriptional regulator